MIVKCQGEIYKETEKKILRCKKEIEKEINL